MKTIKVPLSSAGISNLVKKIEQLKKDLSQADTNIVNKMSEYALKEIETNISATPYKDGNDDISFFEKGTDKKKIVGMSGSQVLYNEFGTGTQGENSPHPLKSKYGLRGYNTGRRIRKASLNVNEKHGIPIGMKYWVYKDKAGNKVYTTGIPAGLQVYNAAQSLRKKKQEIVKKEVSDALSKL